MYQVVPAKIGACLCCHSGESPPLSTAAQTRWSRGRRAPNLSVSVQRASAAEEKQEAPEFPLLQEGKGAPLFSQHPTEGLQTGHEFLGLLSAPRTHILLFCFLFLKCSLGNVSGEDHNLICNIRISSSDNSPSWLRPCSLSQFCSVGCAEGAGVPVQ